MEMTLSSASIGQFLDSLIEMGRSGSTVRAYRSDLWIAMVGVDTCRANDPSLTLDRALMQWLNSNREQWEATTFNRRVSAVKAWARHHKIQVLEGFQTPTLAPAEAHPLAGGIDAVVRLLETADTPAHQALIALCGLCGLRVVEARRVSTRDLRFATNGTYGPDGMDVSVRIDGKGRKYRVVPISDKAWFYIRSAYLEALGTEFGLLVPLSDRGAREAISRIGRKAGIEVSSHDLRMTFGTSVYAETLDLRTTQELLGHSSAKTTQLYTGISTATKRAAVNKL